MADERAERRALSASGSLTPRRIFSSPSVGLSHPRAPGLLIPGAAGARAALRRGECGS